MKILKARLSKNQLEPELEILVDKWPKDEFKFVAHILGIATLYYAETSDGAVDFLLQDPRNTQGFGGSRIEVKLKSKGEEPEKSVILDGPWSSNSSYVNSLNIGYKNIEVSRTDDPEAFERGYTFIVGKISVDLARTWLHKIDPEATIVEPIKDKFVVSTKHRGINSGIVIAARDEPEA
jgi:hypothetical protein